MRQDQLGALRAGGPHPDADWLERQTGISEPPAVASNYGGLDLGPGVGDHLVSLEALAVKSGARRETEG